MPSLAMGAIALPLFNAQHFRTVTPSITSSRKDRPPRNSIGTESAVRIATKPPTKKTNDQARLPSLPKPTASSPNKHTTSTSVDRPSKANPSDTRPSRSSQLSPSKAGAKTSDHIRLPKPAASSPTKRAPSRPNYPQPPEPNRCHLPDSHRYYLPKPSRGHSAESDESMSPEPLPRMPLVAILLSPIDPRLLGLAKEGAKRLRKGAEDKARGKGVNQPGPSSRTSNEKQGPKSRISNGYRDAEDFSQPGPSSARAQPKANRRSSRLIDSPDKDYSPSKYIRNSMNPPSKATRRIKSPSKSNAPGTISRRPILSDTSPGPSLPPDLAPTNFIRKRTSAQRAVKDERNATKRPRVEEQLLHEEEQPFMLTEVGRLTVGLEGLGR